MSRRTKTRLISWDLLTELLEEREEQATLYYKGKV